MENSSNRSNDFIENDFIIAQLIHNELNPPEKLDYHNNENIENTKISNITNNQIGYSFHNNELNETREKFLEFNYQKLTKKIVENPICLKGKEILDIETFYKFNNFTQEDKKNFEGILVFFRNLDRPFTHYSLLTYYLSIFCSIAFFYFSNHFIQMIEEIDYTKKICFNTLNGVTLFLLIVTRIPIITHNGKMKTKIVGDFRDACHVGTSSLHIFISFHILLLLSLVYLFWIPFFYNINNFKEDYILFIRCISVYLYLLHRIYRPSKRMDVVRTFLEIEIPEICMDYFDCSELLTIFIETNYDTIKLIDFIICCIWLFSIILRFVYLTIIHYPYLYKNIWKHLGFFMLSEEDDSRNFICFKLRIFLLIPPLIGDFLSLLLRFYILFFKGINQKSFVYALSFKNVSCLSRTIIAILDYSKVKNYFIKKIYNTYSCFDRWDFIMTLKNFFEDQEKLAGITIMIIYLSYLTLRIIIQLILVKLGLWFSWIILGMEIILCGILSYHYMLKNIGNFLSPDLYSIGIFFLFDISLIYYPILYFNLNSLNQDETIISIFSLYSQDCIYLIFIINTIMFNCAMLIQKCYDYNHVLKIDALTSIEKCFLFLTTSSISNEIILDYTSSMIFFLLYKQNYPSLALNIIILIISIIEHIFSGFFIILINVSGKNSQLDLVKIKSFMKSIRIFVDFSTLVLRIYIANEYHEIFNIYVFKSICRILHSFAVIERNFFEISSIYTDNDSMEKFNHNPEFYFYRIGILNNPQEKNLISVSNVWMFRNRNNFIRSEYLSKISNFLLKKGW